MIQLRESALQMRVLQSGSRISWRFAPPVTCSNKIGLYLKGTEFYQGLMSKHES